jgi:hypothetical protein
LACKPLTYPGVDKATWARVRDQISDDYGISIESDRGEASSRGFTIAWAYDEGEETLTVRCVKKPFLVPCGTVNKRIESTAARCGVAPAG